MQTTEIISWLASTACLTGLLLEVRRNRLQTVFVTSSLALPFYAAGILQWFLFGIATNSGPLIVPCGFQLLCLCWLIKPYVSYHRGREQ